MIKSNNGSNPDIISCLANLSSDEVFTPPEIANKMLDLLPQDLFKSPETKFLDPACKSGVFLREITKRLIVGLEDVIPELQERVDHILHNQVYGIAITELTSYLTRRSLYCSTYPNGEFSISKFDNPEGNIVFRRTQHTWRGGRCIYCGANQEKYDRGSALETYAYEFIHSGSVGGIFNMKFDVVISNPPYQLVTGGAQAQAVPLYHKFISQAKKMRPKYISMVVPSRWFTGGFGLNSFRDEMLHDNHLRVIHDYLDSFDCFPSLGHNQIKGGVSYFLWDRDNVGLCKVYSYENGTLQSSLERSLLEDNCDIFIRYNGAISILSKIRSFKEKSFSDIISSQRPFGLPTNFIDYSREPIAGGIKLYGFKFIGYLPGDFKFEKNTDLIDKWKLFTPKAVGVGDSKQDRVKPIIGEPNSVCTETYVVCGTYASRKEAENASSYIGTKFFHFLLTLRKNTQDALANVYQFIPIQDFSKPWSDEELYRKYYLTDEEIAFIDEMIPFV